MFSEFLPKEAEPAFKKKLLYCILVVNLWCRRLRVLVLIVPKMYAWNHFLVIGVSVEVWGKGENLVTRVKRSG
jgi:hypothetical protein